MKNKSLILTLLLICSLSIAAETSQENKAEVKISGEKAVTIENGCTVERYAIYSPSMDKDIKIAVVLPGAYSKNADAKFPVVYTLHGSGAPYDTFANMSRFRSALNEMPFIYTCFDGQRSRYLDSPTDKSSLYETFFIKEFIPFIESNYRINNQRGIAGFSMGGFGTTYHVLTKPEMFVAACGLSSSITHFKGNTPRLERYENFLGDIKQYPERYKAIDCHELLKSNIENGIKLPTLRYCCGTEDFQLCDSRDFRDLMVKLNAQITAAAENELSADLKGPSRRNALAKAVKDKLIDFTYEESPGGHTWPYWHGQAPDLAHFFWKEFQKDAAAKE